MPESDCYCDACNENSLYEKGDIVWRSPDKTQLNLFKPKIEIFSDEELEQELARRKENKEREKDQAINNAIQLLKECKINISIKDGVVYY